MPGNHQTPVRYYSSYNGAGNSSLSNPGAGIEFSDNDGRPIYHHRAPLSPVSLHTPEKRKPRSTGPMLVALCIGTLLAGLETAILATALPAIASDLDASDRDYTWIVSSYLLANAACAPLWGRASDIWSRKAMLLLVNGLFLGGSSICGLATNLRVMIAGRTTQGVGGGGMIILANVCVSDLFSPRVRPKYYGMIGTIYGITDALGPLIGGVITSGLSWRWCFYLNLPIGAICIGLLLLSPHVQSSPGTSLREGLRSVDWLGTLTLVGGTTAFLLGLQLGGETYSWDSAPVVCLILFGILSWAMAIVIEWKVAKYPVIPIHMFRNWHNTVMLLICYCHGIVFTAGTYYIPLYFQVVLELTPMLSSVYMLPMALSLAITGMSAGFLIKRTGSYRALIVVSLLFLTLGYGLFIDLKPYTSWPRIITYQLISGLAAGALFLAPSIGLQANVSTSDTAAATAAFGFIRQLSSALSLILGSAIYHGILGQSTAAPGQSGPGIQETASSVDRPVANTHSAALSRMWALYTGFAGCAFFLSLCIRPVELKNEHDDGEENKPSAG